MPINLNLPKLFKQFDNAEWTKEQFLAATESDDYKDLICLDSTNGWIAKNGVMYGGNSSDPLDLYEEPAKPYYHISFAEKITVADLCRNLTYNNKPLKYTVDIYKSPIIRNRYTLMDGSYMPDETNIIVIVYTNNVVNHEESIQSDNKNRSLCIPDMSAVYVGQLPTVDNQPVCDPTTELTIFRHYGRENTPVTLLKRIGAYNATSAPKIAIKNWKSKRNKYKRPLVSTVYELDHNKEKNVPGPNKSLLINPFMNVGDRALLDGTHRCKSLYDFISKWKDLYGTPQTVSKVQALNQQYGETFWVDMCCYNKTLGFSHCDLSKPNMRAENGKTLPRLAGMLQLAGPGHGRMSAYSDTDDMLNLSSKIIIPKAWYEYIHGMNAMYAPTDNYVIAKIVAYKITDNECVPIINEVRNPNTAGTVHTVVIDPAEFTPFFLSDNEQGGNVDYYAYDCAEAFKINGVDEFDFIAIKQLYIPVNTNTIATDNVRVSEAVVLYHYNNKMNYCPDNGAIGYLRPDNLIIQTLNSRFIDFNMLIAQKQVNGAVQLPTRGGIIISACNSNVPNGDCHRVIPRLYKYANAEDKIIKEFDERCKLATKRTINDFNKIENFQKYMFNAEVSLYAKWHHREGFLDEGRFVKSRTVFAPITITRAKKFFDRTATANLYQPEGAPQPVSKPYKASVYVIGRDEPTVYGEHGDNRCYGAKQYVVNEVMNGGLSFSKNYLARLFSKLLFGNSTAYHNEVEEVSKIKNMYLGDIDSYHKVKYVDVIAMPLAAQVTNSRANLFAPKYGRRFRFIFNMSDFTIGELENISDNVNTATHTVKLFEGSVLEDEYEVFGDANNSNDFVKAISSEGVLVRPGERKHIHVSIVDMGFDFVQ